MIRLLVADDHASVHESMDLLASREEDIEIVGRAASREELLKLVGEVEADVLLLDMRMPHEPGGRPLDIGPEMVVEVVALRPNIAVLPHSSITMPMEVLSVLDSPARGFVFKSGGRETVLAAVRKVARGNRYICEASGRMLGQWWTQSAQTLTARQAEILRSFAEGLSDEEIANRHCLSRLTVRNNILEAKGKLGLETRLRLMNWLHRGS